LNSKWTAHLNDSERKQGFEDVVRNSTQVLTRLSDIIQEEIDRLNREKISEEGFKDPNWPYLQAHVLGQIRALVKLKKLTEGK
jgi:hypothetical protein